MVLKPLLFLFFVGIAASVFGQVNSPPQHWDTTPPVKHHHYNATEYGIYYPPKWTLDTSGLLETQFIVTSPKESDDDLFRENISLKVKDSENLHNFVVSSENWIRSNGTLIESQRRINDGRQEYHVMVYLLNGQPNLVYEQYYYFKYNFLYELTYVQERARFLKNRTEGEYVLNAFGFKFQNNNTPPVLDLYFR